MIIWKLWLYSFKWGMVACSALESGCVAAQNVVVWRMTPAKLSNKTTVLWVGQKQGVPESFGLSLGHFAELSKRGESGLSYDPKILIILKQMGNLQAYFWVMLGSSKWAQHFELPHSHFLEQRRLPYLIFTCGEATQVNGSCLASSSRLLNYWI